MLVLLLLSGHIYALTRGVAVCLCNCHRLGIAVVAVRSHLCPNTWGGVAVCLCKCHRLGVVVAVRSHLCPNTWGGCMFV